MHVNLLSNNSLSNYKNLILSNGYNIQYANSNNNEEKNIITETATINVMETSFTNFYKTLSEIVNKNTKATQIKTKYDNNLSYLTRETKELLLQMLEK